MDQRGPKKGYRLEIKGVQNIYQRLLAIAGGSVSLHDKNKVPIVGIIWRQNILEKCFVTYSEVDPTPEKLSNIVINLLEKHYFVEKQIKSVLILNSIMAGLGILDLDQLKSAWQVPLIIISEKYPDNQKILSLIKNLQYDSEYEKVLLKNPQKWFNIQNSKLFFCCIGTESKKAENLISELQTVGQLPEPLRIASLVAKAIL